MIIKLCSWQPVKGVPELPTSWLLFGDCREVGPVCATSDGSGCGDLRWYVQGQRPLAHLTMASLLFSHVKTSRDMWHSTLPSNRKKETIQIPQNPSVSHRWGWWAYRCQRWARSVQPSRVHLHTAPRAPWARPDGRRRPPAREECYRDHDTAVLAESITA